MIKKTELIEFKMIAAGVIILQVYHIHVDMGDKLIEQKVYKLSVSHDTREET